MAEPEGSQNHAKELLSLPLSDVIRILDHLDLRYTFTTRMHPFAEPGSDDKDNVSDTVCSNAHVKDTTQMRRETLCCAGQVY